ARRIRGQPLPDNHETPGHNQHLRSLPNPERFMVSSAKQQMGLALEIAKRSDDASGFVVLTGRWVVERTPSWPMRSRRLVRDHETLSAVLEQMVLWSVMMLMSRRLARRRA
ncbi:hypothetical protein AB0N09_42910, partial [Streptomyces erythrochromogenes]